MTLLRRIIALERVVRETPRTCAECRDAPDPAATLVYEPEHDGTPDECPACGRRLVYRLTFDRAG